MPFSLAKSLLFNGESYPAFKPPLRGEWLVAPSSFRDAPCNVTIHKWIDLNTTRR